MKKIIDLYKKYKEVVDYLFWGAAAFFLYMFIYWIFTSCLGMKEVVATLIDNLLVIIFAFFTNKIFVFRSKTESAGAFFKEFASFFAARIFTLVLSELMTWIGCDVLGYNTNSYHLSFINDGLIVQLITQVVVIVTNYVLSKLWIFKGKKDNSETKDLADE